jgi:Flp pilus assembly protein TadG
MAMILPLFIALVLGQIESMRLGMVLQLMNVAAREGCRVAVVNGRTQADVQARVNAVLQGSGITAGTVTPTPANWATCAGGTAVTVSLSIPYSTVSWLPTPQYFQDANLSASATFSSERP